MPDRTVAARCCIVGGGPAGMMLGFLLARSGVDIVVLEKHRDFLRDFRGDTIHPSTLEIMHELGLLQSFLAIRHSELQELTGEIGGERIVLADFRHLTTRCKFIAVMPQWDLLDFLAERGRHYAGFRLAMATEAVGLLREEGRVAGVVARDADGDLTIRADLTVACDGRHSALRRCAGLPVKDLGAPMDVLWLRLPRQPGDPPQTLGRIDYGRMMVLIDRVDYWQCAVIIRKGTFEAVRSRGLDAFRADIVKLAPFFEGRVDALTGWRDVKLLTVVIDRLEHWAVAGLLCIGDAAHAMSPVGGVGINLAVQDAVAAANILAPTLRGSGSVEEEVLRRVQRRREWPARMTQSFQRAIQDNLIAGVLNSAGGKAEVPWTLRLFGLFPPLRRIPARLIGMGFRPEHVGPSV